jgi:Mg2+ and Co2+ transporter CorA
VQVTPNIQGRVWRSGKPQDDFRFADISDYLAEPDALVWVDLSDPDHDTLCDLASELGLNTLVNLRRVALPMREVVNSIQHHRSEVGTSHEPDPLYADLYDHVLRVSEWTESLRDMITTIFETNLSLQDARLNTIMKKLTG